MAFWYRLSATLLIMLSLVALLIVGREMLSYEITPAVVTRIVSLRDDLCVNADFLLRGSLPTCVVESYIVRFHTKAGQWIETTFIGAGNSAVPHPGDKWTVAYNPSDPKGTATEYREVQWNLVSSGGIGLLGICMLFLDWIWHQFWQKSV